MVVRELTGRFSITLGANAVLDLRYMSGVAPAPKSVVASSNATVLLSCASAPCSINASGWTGINNLIIEE